MDILAQILGVLKIVSLAIPVIVSFAVYVLKEWDRFTWVTSKNAKLVVFIVFAVVVLGESYAGGTLTKVVLSGDVGQIGLFTAATAATTVGLTWSTIGAYETLKKLFQKIWS